MVQVERSDLRQTRNKDSFKTRIRDFEAVYQDTILDFEQLLQSSGINQRDRKDEINTLMILGTILTTEEEPMPVLVKYMISASKLAQQTNQPYYLQPETFMSEDFKETELFSRLAFISQQAKKYFSISEESILTKLQISAEHALHLLEIEKE